MTGCISEVTHNRISDKCSNKVEKVNQKLEQGKSAKVDRHRQNVSQAQYQCPNSGKNIKMTTIDFTMIKLNNTNEMTVTFNMINLSNLKLMYVSSRTDIKPM